VKRFYTFTKIKNQIKRCNLIIRAVTIFRVYIDKEEIEISKRKENYYAYCGDE